MVPKVDTPPLEVSSVYLPNHCLEGEEIPAHVLWSGGKRVSVVVRLPPELQLKQVFNARPKRGDGLKNGVLTVSRFEIPGYLGLVLQARRSGNPSRIVSLQIDVLDGQGNVVRSAQRNVTLFRPLLRKIDVPLGSRVVLSSSGRGVLEKRIVLANAGDGTALVRVEVTRLGVDMITSPSGVTEFLTNYREEVTSELRKAKTEFPRWKGLLENLAEYQEAKIEFGPKNRRKLYATVRNLQRAVETNRKFVERIQEILLGAYFRNIKFVTEVNSLLDYLNSIGTGRVIIANAIDVIRLEPGSSTLSLRVSLADVALRDYPPVELGSFVIDSEFPVEIPIHCLFDWRVATSTLEQRLGA